MSLPELSPGSRVFADETKAKGYVIAAAAVSASTHGAVAAQLRRLTRPGQSRIHFKSEGDRARKLLLAQMSELGIHVTAFSVRGPRERVARQKCLEALVDRLVAASSADLVLESVNQNVDAADRKIIREHLQKRGAETALSYRHAVPAQEPMLWVADAAAWCIQAGGDWLRRSENLIVEVTELRD